jgi:hypothetical protein
LSNNSFGKFERRRVIATLVALMGASLLIACYIYFYGTGLGLGQGQGQGHENSEAYFGSNVSYLDAGSSQLWSCDHSTDGWRNRAEAYDRQSGDHMFVRDPDGAGGSCGRKDTGRHWEWHREWGGGDYNAGEKSFHLNR